jgi:RES domain-containing protein
MIVYRLATALYKNDLSGTGAKLYGGRWNSPGIPALYSTENISLAVLEILVRADKHTIPDTYHLIKINVPGTASIVNINKEKLKQDWKDDIEYTQWMGDEFIKTNEGLLLKVPSAIVDEENNYLFNSNHKDFQKVKILQTSVFRFDKRLFIEDE